MILEDAPRILVVEDDMFISLMVETILLENRFLVTLSSSAEKAIELLNDQVPKFRAIISDINLGLSTLNGWDVVRRARELDPDISVVYMTGHAEDEWTSHGVPRSVLVKKPFVPVQIVTALSNFFNQQS